MRDAARRWGADFLEVLTPLGDHGHPYAQKLAIGTRFEEEDRVVYLDADVVIRRDCPNLFEIVPEDAVGAVRSWQPGHECGDGHSILRWCEARGMPPVDIRTEYHNSGLLVFTSGLHRRSFQLALDKYFEDPGACENEWAIGDQAPLASAIKATGQRYFWLAPTFNRCGAKLWNGWTPEMSDFVWHFCGPIDKEMAGQSTLWRDLGPERLTRGGQVRWKDARPCDRSEEAVDPAFLYRLLRELPRRCTIVDVGTWLGSSLFHILNGTEDLEAEIHCVDDWHGDAASNPSSAFRADVHDGFLDNLREMGAPQNVVIHRGSSIETARDFDDERIDLVFLDASTDCERVRADLAAWWPKVRAGGLVAGRCYGPSSPGVVKALNEFFGEPPQDVDPGRDSPWRVAKRHRPAGDSEMSPT